MSDHLFLSPEASLQPNWQQAFPGARIAHPGDPKALRIASSIVWMLTTDTEQTLALMPALAGTPVVALSALPNPDQAMRLLAAGCRGYCHSLAAPEQLQDVAAVIARGGLWIGQDLMQRGARRIQESGLPTSPLWNRLTPREQEVAQGVADGLSNKEICRKLGIEERTVKAHMTSILQKTGARDRLQLIVRLGKR